MPAADEEVVAGTAHQVIIAAAPLEAIVAVAAEEEGVVLDAAGHLDIIIARLGKDNDRAGRRDGM